MSVSEISGSRHKVAWRSAQHTQKCQPGCVKTVHQHTRTFDNRPDAVRFDTSIRTRAADMRDMGITESAGILPARPASTVRTFRALALACIADKVARGKWSASTGKLRKCSLGKLGKWADQPITSAALDLKGAQGIVSGLKYPDSPISLIKSTMDYATREGDIASHAMSALEADRSRIPAARRDFIFTSAGQLSIITGALDARLPGLGLALALMRWCGLRTGETLGVERDDFREGFSILRVSRQIDDRGHAVSLKGKHAGESRTVPVPGHLAGRLAAHVATCKGKRLFTAPRGGAVDRNVFNETAKDGAALAGLPAAWVPYQCRHHYASDLISKCVPIDRVAKMLGHASTAITYRTYSHLMPGELDDIRAVLDTV